MLKDDNSYLPKKLVQSFNQRRWMLSMIPRIDLVYLIFRLHLWKIGYREMHTHTHTDDLI